MKINKDDLILKKAKSWSFRDFYSYYFSRNNYNLNYKDNAYDVFIGNFRIAQIVELSNKICIISNCYSYYKSLDNALKKIVKEINCSSKSVGNKVKDFKSFHCGTCGGTVCLSGDFT